MHVSIIFQDCLPGRYMTFMTFSVWIQHLQDFPLACTWYPPRLLHMRLHNMQGCLWHPGCDTMLIHDIQDSKSCWYMLSRMASHVDTWYTGLPMCMQDIKDWFPCSSMISRAVTYMDLWNPVLCIMWIHDIQDLFQCLNRISRASSLVGTYINQDCVQCQCMLSRSTYLGPLLITMHDFPDLSHVGTWYSGLLPMRVNTPSTSSHTIAWYQEHPTIWIACLELLHIWVHGMQDFFQPRTLHRWVYDIHNFLPCTYNISRTASYAGSWYQGVNPIW